MYKGENGIDNLNKLLQNIFNPRNEDKKEIQVGAVTYTENGRCRIPRHE
jgi:exodeoxyribonuclease V alpha subunit